MADFVAMRDAFKLIKELFAAMGVRDDYARNLGKWLREAGMVDVGGVVLDVRLGAMNEKSDMAAMGAESYRLATAGLVKAARCECGLSALVLFVPGFSGSSWPNKEARIKCPSE